MICSTQSVDIRGWQEKVGRACPSRESSSLVVSSYGETALFSMLSSPPYP